MAKQATPAKTTTTMAPGHRNGVSDREQRWALRRMPAESDIILYPHITRPEHWVIADELLAIKVVIAMGGLAHNIRIDDVVEAVAQKQNPIKMILDRWHMPCN